MHGTCATSHYQALQHQLDEELAKLAEEAIVQR